MSLAYAVSDARILVTRSLRRSRRDPEAFFTALALPVILMLMFVYIFGGAFRAGGSYANYVVPGLIVLSAGFGALTTAVAVATDMSTGIVDRLRSMPIHASAVITGNIVASLARNLVATALVIGLGLAVGWRPGGSALDWLAAAGLIVWFIFAISWVAAALGLLAGSPDAANGMAMALTFIPYASTAFVPAATMPGPVAAFAAHQPFTPVIETLRGLWMGHTSDGTAVGTDAVLAVVYCTVILGLAAVAVSWLFRHRSAAAPA